MSWGIVASAAVSIGGSYLSSRSASKAADTAADASAAQLAFAQEQYDDWLDIYGPIQDNLSEYFQNLTPESYAASGLEDFEGEFQRSMTQLNESLVQRGIDPSSGVGLSLEQQSKLDAAETRADIRKSARDTVTAQKMEFLGLGMGVDKSSGVTNALSQQSQTANQLAAESRASANAALANTAGTIGDAAYNILNRDTSGLK